MLNTKIGIIGCGWLGLPLAKKIIAENYNVKGSTRSKEKLENLRKVGIEPFYLQLSEAGIDGEIDAFLEDVDVLILNMPPGLRRNPDKNHVLELKHLIHEIEQSKVEHVLYISSTSVFKDSSDFLIIKDTTQPNGTSKAALQLRAIETLLRDNNAFKTTILRFGGLFSNDRHPGKMLSGRTNIKNPKAPINLIHRLDCIGVINAILTQDYWNKTLNAVYPLHTPKKDYYSKYSDIHKIQRPEYLEASISLGKLVQSDAVEQVLNYKFRYSP